MIVAHHYSQYALTNDIASGTIWKILSAQGGFLGVAIFFFLSGYGLMESDKKNHLSVRGFFKKRFLKIYGPVFLVTAVWLPVYYTIITPPYL